jgi:hypothetical protein
VAILATIVLAACIWWAGVTGGYDPLIIWLETRQLPIGGDTWLFLFLCIPIYLSAIGVLMLEKVVRELFISRKAGAELAEAVVDVTKTWVVDGFKEDKDKRPPKA